MTIKVVSVPDIGEGVAEAEIVEWHVLVGETVKEDQVLAAVMTDKATVEIPSPLAGVIVELGGEVGSRLAVGSRLVGIDIGNGDDTSGTNASDAAVRPNGCDDAIGVSRNLEVAPLAGADRSDAAQALSDRRNVESDPKAGLTLEKPVASPSVRARSREAGIDLRLVTGSAAAGRITQQDLADFIKSRSANTGRPKQMLRTEAVERIKLVGLRRAIAEKMTESHRRIAPFSYIEEVDVTALEELRKHLNASYADSRPKLTVLPFLAAALVLAVRKFPQMNGTYDDDSDAVSRYGGVHIGIATQTPTGLMVPVIRHAEALDLWECAAEIKRVAEAARQGSASRHDLIGSTITVTSLGDLGGIATTPVINRPELAIVGVNRMVIRPVWQHGQFIPRTMMNLSSSFDHRIIDGLEAAQFIRFIKQLIETPALLFVGA